MKKVLFILFLAALGFKGQAADIDRTCLPDHLQPCLNVPGTNNPFREYVIELPDTANLKKFMYAEMVWQVSYTVEKIWVNGKSISQEVKSKVATAKYRDLALEVMGEDGWELTTSVTRNIDAGFEIFYYFKKSRD